MTTNNTETITILDSIVGQTIEQLIFNIADGSHFFIFGSFVTDLARRFERGMGLNLLLTFIEDISREKLTFALNSHIITVDYPSIILHIYNYTKKYIFITKRTMESHCIYNINCILDILM